LELHPTPSRRDRCLGICSAWLGLGGLFGLLLLAGAVNLFDDSIRDLFGEAMRSAAEKQRQRIGTALIWLASALFVAMSVLLIHFGRQQAKGHPRGRLWMRRWGAAALALAPGFGALLWLFDANDHGKLWPLGALGLTIYPLLLMVWTARK
jgi:hypothetical protein